MIAITKTISTRVEKAIRLIKVYLFGGAREPYEAMPYGTDSNPIANIDAIYVSTSMNNIPVVVGYFNKSRLAEVGEHRTYSTDNTGAVMFYIWQKNDGTCEIGGNTKHMMRFEDFDSVIQSYLVSLNSAISTGIGSAGGTYTPPSAPDFTSAKINEIKTL